MIKFKYENCNEDELDLFSFEEDEDFINDDFNQELADKFANDMLDFLDYIMSKSYIVKEDFVSDKCMNDHFTKHCIGHTNKKSTKNRIFYDFVDKSDYIDYEKEISNKIMHTKYNISSLYDYNTIMDYMRKLFEGNIAVRFCNSCGIQNRGPVNISFISYATKFTSTYEYPNTISICIKNVRDKTISLYAIDAHDVERRLRNTLKNYANFNSNFAFNND